MSKYPMKEVASPFGGTTYREMTPDEYTQQLAWFETAMYRYLDSKYRREREYGSYLWRWFGDGQCDGSPDIFHRLDNHLLPMPYNIYFG